MCNSTVNVCMRWNSDKVLDEETRNNIHAQHVQQYEQWLQWLPGWDNFPFKEVKHNVIAWAVANDSQLVGNRDGFHVYTEFKDENGAPDCDPGCSRHLHQDGDFSKCGRGAENRYQQYFLVDKAWGDYNMGAASGEGITVSEYGWDHVGSQLGNWSILVHETVRKLPWITANVKTNILRVTPLASATTSTTTATQLTSVPSCGFLPTSNRRWSWSLLTRALISPCSVIMRAGLLVTCGLASLDFEAGRRMELHTHLPPSALLGRPNRLSDRNGYLVSGLLSGCGRL